MTCLFGRCRKFVVKGFMDDNGTYIKQKMDFPDSVDVLHLCECLYSTTSISLQQAANKIISAKVAAEFAFILTVSDEQRELTCQVIGDTALPEEIKFPVENSCFLSVLQQKGCSILNKIKGGCGLENVPGFQFKSMLCVPLFRHGADDRITNILCLANKKNFTSDDLEVAKVWVKYLAPLLFKSQGYEEERKIRKQSQSLLLVVKTLLVQIDNLSLLLKEIMTEARKLTEAERCSLFLLDKEQNELVAKVFDGDETENANEVLRDIRIPATEGIAGHVALSGELLNIHDAYAHPMFYSKVDETTGFKTRNILCFPIMDDKGVIGVAELCNKVNGTHFTYFDEEIASTFSVYCAICIMHSLMWKKVRDDQSRSRLSNGLIMQTNVSEEEVLNLISVHRVSDFIDEKFSTFTYIPRLLKELDAAQAAVYMFDDLGMTQLWRINKKVLTRFVVTVKQGYRDPPYHNWMHGFSVAHFAYLLLKNLKLMGNQLSYLEGLSLLVACLCHDLDHRGTTSSFQVTCKSILAALYSSEGSVLERHHFAQTMAILHTDGCNILENLSEEEYTKCLDNIRMIILATDLAHHFRIIKDIREMLQDGYDWSKPKHHELLLCLSVTCCDLSDQTKDWQNTKEIAKLIYKEFFKQGDLEKAIGVNPSEMMDRNRAQIPRLQINFLQQVVLPVYQFLAGFFPTMKEVIEIILKHRVRWEKVEHIFTKHYTPNISQLDFLDDEKVDAAALSV